MTDNGRTFTGRRSKKKPYTHTYIYIQFVISKFPYEGNNLEFYMYIYIYIPSSNTYKSYYITQHNIIYQVFKYLFI